MLPRIHLHRSRVLRVAALAVGAFVACDSPFEPRGEGERVPVGQEITDVVSGDSMARYSFASQSGGPYVVFLSALDGTVQLYVIDSTNQYVAASLSAGPGSPPLYQNATLAFGTEPGDVYQLRIATFPASAHARFRFVVYPINTAPEQLPDVIALGDTVTGETIDPIVDLDEFIVHGQAGQEFVAVAQTPAPPGSGAVILTVIDPVAPNSLGYVIAEAGPSPPFTTGRMRLTATHAYKVILGSTTSFQYPRYRGPYRFWTYLIDRAPEHRSAPILFDTEVGNERIDRAGDVDEFTLFASAGTDLNAFLQGSSRVMQLEVVGPSGVVIAATASQTSDTSLFAHATSRFQVPQTGTYVVRVTGTNFYEVADTGGYRFYVYAIDRRPEHVPQAITPGDTVVGEDIGLSGDIDEFTFSGAAGEEFEASFQALNGSTETRLQLDLVDGAGTVLRSAESVGTDTSLVRQVTGRFALPAAGTYRLRISGAPYYPYDFNRGAYRLVLYRIDRRPEALPQTLAFGDSLSGESIDVPGDVDEFQVTVPDTSGANLVLEVENPSAVGLPVQLVDSATGQVIATTSTSQVGTRAATGRLRVAPGKYIVRVGSSGDPYDRSTVRGLYRLWFYRFGFGPEGVADTFAIGDTVSGESIEPWGDDDQFHFYGLKGQHINVALQGLADTTGGGFEAWISGPAEMPSWMLALVSSAAADTTLRDHQTRRLDLPVTGWYRVEMTGVGATRGPYRLLVEALGTTPESSPAALVPGDSVTESIDSPGDWDEFTVTATPGAELEVLLHGTSSVSSYPSVLVSDPSTGDTLASQVFQAERVVGPFLVPASGQVTIAVYQPGGFTRFCYDATCGGALGVVGPYAFRVRSLNRAPENVPSTYTVGDTTRGEAISPAGDIDEFTSSGTPGDQLTLFYRLAGPATPDGGLITLEVVDPATGLSLVGSNAAVFGTVFFSPGSFTVPSSGAFIVRAHGYGLFGTWTATAPYEFFVKHGP